jgi:hypothetical protein
MAAKSIGVEQRVGPPILLELAPNAAAFGSWLSRHVRELNREPSFFERSQE